MCEVRKRRMGHGPRPAMGFHPRHVRACRAVDKGAECTLARFHVAALAADPVLLYACGFRVTYVTCSPASCMYACQTHDRIVTNRARTVESTLAALGTCSSSMLIQSPPRLCRCTACPAYQ